MVQEVDGNEVIIDIDDINSKDALDKLFVAGVKSIEYDANNETILFIFLSTLNKSYGIIYSNRVYNNGELLEYPFETVSLTTLTESPNWYYYVHTTID